MEGTKRKGGKRTEGERSTDRGKGGLAGGGGGAPSSGGSHSLSARTPDRWREGERCQEAVTAGGQSGGGGGGRVLCGQFLSGEGAAAGGLAAGVSLEPAPRELLAGAGE